MFIIDAIFVVVLVLVVVGGLTAYETHTTNRMIAQFIQEQRDKEAYAKKLLLSKMHQRDH